MLKISPTARRAVPVAESRAGLAGLATAAGGVATGHPLAALGGLTGAEPLVTGAFAKGVTSPAIVNWMMKPTVDQPGPSLVIHLTLNGWLIIDGGGNRPALDATIAAEANLCILPFRASEEDLDTVADDMRRMPNAIAWPTAWPTNAYAERAASFYIEALAKAFPLRVISTPIPFVNSVSELLAASLDAPSTPVRQLARKVFDVMSETFDERQINPVAQAIAS